MRDSTTPSGTHRSPALSRHDATRILSIFASARGRLPQPDRVAVRRNVRRLASLSRPRGGGVTLNLSTAVLEAGPEAWALVAPALGGDRDSLARLRDLTAEGIRATREGRASRNPRAVRGEAARDPGRPPPLPDTGCEGDPAERAFLLTLIAYLRETCGYPDAIPEDIQVRISRRMTRKLGSCAWSGTSRRITIARRLFRPGLEDILWETVKHEVAHLADQVTSGDGRTSHGAGWKAWARRLGARPERLCSIDEARRIDRLQGGRAQGGRALDGRASGGGAPDGRAPGRLSLGGLRGRRASGPLQYPPEVRRWLAARAGG
jgi:hypothetical protein